MAYFIFNQMWMNVRTVAPTVRDYSIAVILLVRLNVCVDPDTLQMEMEIVIRVNTEH